MSDLLRIQGLCKRYGDFSLSDVSLSVPEGSVVGLVGSNGAGKTTTIKAALGLVYADSGTIDLLGCPVTRNDAAAAARARQGVGIVFDTCPFPQLYTVRDVQAVMRATYVGWDDDAFERHIEAFGLTPEKKVGKLSRGMGMKLSLACALSHAARLLVLDEATAGLDPLAREEVLGMLRRYLAHEDRGILMSTHITTDLESIADYVVCIDGGARGLLDGEGPYNRGGGRGPLPLQPVRVDCGKRVFCRGRAAVCARALWGRRAGPRSGVV